MEQEKHSPNLDSVWPVLFTAISVLLAGVFFYRLLRPADSAAFLGLLAPLPVSLRGTALADYLGWFPTFSHVFAFSLLTWLSLGMRSPLAPCLTWVGVNVIFELGQALPDETIRHLPAILNLREYLTAGRFDPLDIAAALAGALAAFLTIRAFGPGAEGKSELIENGGGS